MFLINIIMHLELELRMEHTTRSINLLVRLGNTICHRRLLLLHHTQIIGTIMVMVMDLWQNQVGNLYLRH